MFDGPTFQMYYGEIGRIIRAELDKESPDYLRQVDFDEYLNHLVRHAEWQPLEWHENEMTIEAFTAREGQPDMFDRRRVHVADVKRFRLRIPITPHPQLQDYVKVLPSQMWLSGEPEWQFDGETLIIETAAEEAAVKKALEEVRFWFGGRNRDIEIGNRTLRERIHPIWEGRRRKLEEQHGAAETVLQKLNIPLYRDPNAKAKPVEIRPRQLRTVIAKPTAKAKHVPALQREDVMGLVDFADEYIRQFEVAPKTYTKMAEEELRDLIVSMLNTNYPGSTTAETFSKLGKTDIRLRVNEGDALIFECKVWDGARAYVAAIEQLFGYLTWRQTYGVLISFCRRKDMTAAVEQAKKAIVAHASCTPNTFRLLAPTRFSTRHSHPQDAGRGVEIFHMFYDLSV
jgi:hypothetical protein